MCFFHSFWSFLERYPPNPCVFLVRLERGSALHVKLMVSKIRSVMWSKLLHAFFHCSKLRCSLFSSVCLRSSMIIECCEKKVKLNLSRFSCGMGLSSQVLELVCLVIGRDSMVFGGRFGVIGKWSEFCSKSILVVDVYCVGVGLYM